MFYSESDEIVRLEQENAQLRQEVERLKKALAIAQGMDSGENVIDRIMEQIELLEGRP